MQLSRRDDDTASDDVQDAVLHSDWKSVKQVLLTLLCLNSKYKES